MNHLQLVRHLASRLNLILWAYGERMKRAERAFEDWRTSANTDARATCWQTYLRQSELAARLHAQHSRMALRAIGISRG